MCLSLEKRDKTANYSFEKRDEKANYSFRKRDELLTKNFINVILTIGDTMKRKIYDQLLSWKNNEQNRKPLMVLGVRQSGKTYIIDEFCRQEFANYIYINLFEQNDVCNLYNSDLTSDEKFAQLKILVNFDLDIPGTILFIDEIQESEKLIAELKYFCEKHNNVHIICAGSLLGVKLKRSRFSFPVGKVKMLNMYPMDFEEFLMAMKEDLLIKSIKDAYERNSKISDAIHEKALKLYRIYLITGGMPESVQNMVDAQKDYIKYDQSILKDILESYFNDMNKYVTSDTEALKINRLYKSLPAQLANNSNKFQYSKIDKNARAREYETSLDWLCASNMVIQALAVKTPQIPLKGFVDPDTFKLYLSDVGILCNILGLSMQDILTDNISLYKGIIAENYVANQLICKEYELYYWKSDALAEIDFLLYTKDGIIPVEVKIGDTAKSKSLNTYIAKFHPPYAIRISTKGFGYDKEKKIKSIPLYATFCL